MYEGHFQSDKRINLLFDEVTYHYHSVANLAVPMAKRYDCEGCNKGCRYGVVHACERTSNDYSTSSLYICGPTISYDLCNTCFDNHKKRTRGKRKSACELRKRCCTCCALITHMQHECNNRFCHMLREQRSTIFTLCVI